MIVAVKKKKNTCCIGFKSKDAKQGLTTASKADAGQFDDLGQYGGDLLLTSSLVVHSGFKGCDWAGPDG